MAKTYISFLEKILEKRLKENFINHNTTAIFPRKLQSVFHAPFTAIVSKDLPSLSDLCLSTENIGRGHVKLRKTFSGFFLSPGAYITRRGTQNTTRTRLETDP